MVFAKRPEKNLFIVSKLTLARSPLPHRVVLVLVLILTTTGALFAQDQEKTFESVYYHVATSLSASNIEEAVRVADSLAEATEENSVHKMKSLMLLATLQQRTGNSSKALWSAMAAERIAQLQQDFAWQARISGFLSTTFRTVGLNQKGLVYLEAASRLVKEKELGSTVSILILQEKAYYRLDEQDYLGALALLKDAQTYFDKDSLQPGVRVILATNDQLMGTCQLNLQNFEQAKAHYLKSLALLQDEETELKGFIYVGLGSLYLREEAIDSAQYYFQKAEGYVENSQNFYLLSELTAALAKYYQRERNFELAAAYEAKNAALLAERLERIKQISNELYLYENDGKPPSTPWAWILGGSVGLMALVLTLLWIRHRRLAKTSNATIGVAPPTADEVPIAKPAVAAKQAVTSAKAGAATENTSESIMSKETEERLLDELAKFEADHGFLEKKISLSSLAVRLNTNTKYLSYVIHEHKGKDFSNYINELKISFIVDRLQTSEHYRNLKISTLAEEAGIASHSKFTAIFKTVTGKSPSDYIAQIEEIQDSKGEIQ